MKPRIFIGSSVEGLDIAYTIQSNLEYDSNPTVWAQGIFQLSNNTLEDLITALRSFDFGIFVFTPDDFLQIRDNKFNVVRDNVIFELGLFIGKLGKEKVFFVMPNGVEKFHLPTDLLGVMAGKYNSNREDGNLLAALGPFCSQVRSKLKEFIYENLTNLKDESDEIKSIAVNKKNGWEMQLCAALLKVRMTDIGKALSEVEKGHVFKKTLYFRDIFEFDRWFQTALEDLLKILEIAKNLYLVELQKSFGEPGVAGSIEHIKYVVDKIASLCKDLLVWETELYSIKTPIQLEEIPTLMKGWTKPIINEFDKLHVLLKDKFSDENIAKGELIHIELVFVEPPNVNRINEIFEEIRVKVESGEIKITPNNFGGFDLVGDIG